MNKNASKELKTEKQENDSLNLTFYLSKAFIMLENKLIYDHS